MQKRNLIKIGLIVLLSTFTSCKNKNSYKVTTNDVYTYYENIQYGDSNNERQLLDLVIPKDIKYPNGIIFYIHGGAWAAGSKDTYTNTLIENANKGYISAAINYRYISTTTHCDAIMNDITDSMKMIKNKTNELGLNITKSLITGGSAGGHLSLLYAYKYIDVAPIKPVSVVSSSGPTDLNEDEYFTGEYKNFIYTWFSNLTGHTITEDNYKDCSTYLNEYSPINYVNEETIPTAIFHGELDTLVPYKNAIDLKSKLDEYGIKNDFVTFKNSGHGLDNDEEASNLANSIFCEYAETYLA